MGESFLFGFRKKTEKKLLADLQLFKTSIGSDLPIVRGRK